MVFNVSYFINLENKIAFRDTVFIIHTPFCFIRFVNLELRIKV